MHEDNKHTLAVYRLEKAQTCLNTAKQLINSNNKDYASAANRSYYAIFHSARAIMALDGVDRKRHSGVVSYFQKNYVKTHILSKDMSDIILEAFEIRQEADYEDFFIISVEDVKDQIENAERFYTEVKNYILSQV